MERHHTVWQQQQLWVSVAIKQTVVLVDGLTAVPLCNADIHTTHNLQTHALIHDRDHRKSQLLCHTLVHRL